MFDINWLAVIIFLAVIPVSYIVAGVARGLYEGLRDRRRDERKAEQEAFQKTWREHTGLSYETTAWEMWEAGVAYGRGLRNRRR